MVTDDADNERDDAMLIRSLRLLFSRNSEVKMGCAELPSFLPLYSEQPEAIPKFSIPLPTFLISIDSPRRRIHCIASQNYFVSRFITEPSSIDQLCIIYSFNKQIT